MKTTDVIPVLLICQLLAIVYGDLRFFRPKNQTQSPPQKPLHPSLLQTAQRLNQLLRQPSRQLLQLDPPPQPFSLFQQNNLPQLLFQQPFQQAYLQQQQPYPPQQPLYSPLQQPTQYFNPLQIPLQQVVGADGRPAICTWYAVKGFPFYYCVHPIPQNGFPGTTGIADIPSPSSVKSMFSKPNSSNLFGKRSLLGVYSGFNTDSVLPPATYTTNEQLKTDHTFYAASEGVNTPLPNGPYCPCSNPLCSMCSFLTGSFAPFQQPDQGQLGYTNLYNFPSPPLTQHGNVRLVTSATENVAQLGYLAAHPYYSPPVYPLGPQYSPDFQAPQYPGQGMYQSPGPFPVSRQNLQAVSDELKGQDAGLLPLFPKFTNYFLEDYHPLSDHQKNIPPSNNPYTSLQKPIPAASRAHRNGQLFLGGLNYLTDQRLPPLQPARTPSKFHQYIPRFQEQPPAAPHSPLQAPRFASPQGTFVYKPRRTPAPVSQRALPSLQTVYQSASQPLIPFRPTKFKELQQLIMDSKKRNQPHSNAQHIAAARGNSPGKLPQRKTPFFQADNTHHPRSLKSYLASGLSLLSELDEEPSKITDKSPNEDYKRSSGEKNVKKTFNLTPKPCRYLPAGKHSIRTNSTSF